MSFWTGFFWITLLHLFMGALYLVFKKYLDNAKLNRMVILGIILTPLLLWIPLPVSTLNTGILAVVTLPELAVGVEENIPPGFHWPALYLLVASLFMIYKLRGLVQLSRWLRNGKKGEQEGLWIYRSPAVTVPCSFFDRVFVPYGWSEENEAWIIAHERVHARQFHSVDLLMTNLASALFWVNPIIHVLQKELRLNHEYLADEGVLKNSGNPREYMQLMMANALKTSPSVFVHPFSIHTHLKNRITHMHQTEKRSRIYLLWIPFIAVLLSWTACNQKETVPQNGSETETPLDATQVDQMPEMEGGTEALMTFLTNEIVYPESQKGNREDVKVMVRFTVSSDGSVSDVEAVPGRTEVAKEFSDEAVRAVLAMPKWKPGMKDGKAVPVRLLLPVRFTNP